MGFPRHISALAASLFKRPQPVVVTAPASGSYGVVVDGPGATDGITNPVFLAQATPVADKIVALLKERGLNDESLLVTIGALPTIGDHKGVRFEAPAAIAQDIANALPGHVVMGSNCRVICPKTAGPKSPRSEVY